MVSWEEKTYSSLLTDSLHVFFLHTSSGKDKQYFEIYDNIKIGLKDIQNKKVLNFREEIFKIF